MGVGEVFHMDVVANSGAVRRRVVGAVNRDRITLACGNFAGDLDQ